MNDSDNKDTFSNTPNEDWTENDKTNSLSDTENVEENELVEESSIPLVEEEEITEIQGETEEIMDIDNTVEQIGEDILGEDIQDEMTESEILETAVIAVEENEINEVLEEEKHTESTTENLEEELDTENESTLEEKINIEETSFIEEEILTELNDEIEPNDFIENTEETTLNGSQNDMVASLENTEVNESSFIAEKKVIDLDREEATRTTVFSELSDKKDEEVLETSTFIHEEDNEENMLRKPNFLFAILGGLGGILFSSLFWAETALLLDQYYNYDHKYAYMALFVGLCVGLGIRWAGRGTTYGYAILAVIFTLGGSLSGTLLSTLVHVVEAFGVSYFEILDVFDFTFLYGLLEDRFQNLDIAFYTSAVILAYWLATRKKSK